MSSERISSKRTADGRTVEVWLNAGHVELTEAGWAELEARDAASAA